jgi:hypothetical protein
MLRHAVRALVVAGFVMAAWAVGHAQSTPAPRPSLSDFELAVSIVSGHAEITCVRGCVLTWAPKVLPTSGDVEVHVPRPTLMGDVTPDGCVGGANNDMLGSCRIWGWKR